MLVDDPQALESIFKEVKTLIATHCEKDPLVKQNQAEIVAQFGEGIDASYHPKIRSEEACYLSSSFAVELAKEAWYTLTYFAYQYSQLELFDSQTPLVQKITVQKHVCITYGLVKKIMPERQLDKVESCGEKEKQ